MVTEADDNILYFSYSSIAVFNILFAVLRFLRVEYYLIFYDISSNKRLITHDRVFSIFQFGYNPCKDDDLVLDIYCYASVYLDGNV